ncbi:MAG: hypothetical protein KatS3mg044_0869 [Rhodothermaceae bacterium]|nr:MAG: hypothetical protein KatS3mg044_0869 [Rhodothermaceae bacterium]
MKRIVYGALTGWLLLALVGRVVPARAQQTHTVVIQDGRVQIDGKVLERARLPEGLDLDGVQAHLTFSGPGRPLLEINGALYEVSPEGMVRVGDAGGNGRVSVFFRSFEPVPGDSLLIVGPRGRQAVGDPLAREQVLRRARIEADEARVEADEARVEMQRYLEDLRNQNTRLFERLVRERQMEMETRALAARIQQMPEGRERDALIEQLRTRLDEIFELKQQNRHQEIAQLEIQLETLRREMQERERLRERIVEQRLRELLGQPSPFDW